jgi:hypothetical protein
MTQVTQRTMDWLLVIVGNLSTAFWLFWQHARGGTSAETTMITTPIVFVIVDVTVLLSIRAKNHSKQLKIPASLILTAVLLALTASGSLWASLRQDLYGNELLNEANSSKPISEIRPERNAILVQLLRARLRNSRETVAATKTMKPIAPALYSPGSFENESVIRSVISQVETAASFDINNAEKQETAMTEFRARMSKADPAYLALFETNRKKEEDEDRQALTQEKEWYEATIDLYKFAAANQKAIKIEEHRVALADPKLQAIFDKKKEHSAELLGRVQAAEKKLADRQEKFSSMPLAKMGLR